MAASWVVDSLPVESRDAARLDASRRLVKYSLNALGGVEADDVNLRFIAEAYELALLDLLEAPARRDATDDEFARTRVGLGAEAFHFARALLPSGEPVDIAREYLRKACLGVLGDRATDVARMLREIEWPALPLTSRLWDERTLSTILDVWLRLIRKNGWADLRAVQEQVVRLRESQAAFESDYLQSVSASTRITSKRTAAWELILLYHLAKAAELLSRYTTQGRTEEGFDIREQLQSQFDSALAACARADLIEWDSITRLLSHTAKQLVDNSIWTSTRAVNTQVSEFVESLVSPDRSRPLFDLLPPQRRALREAGMRGGGDRAIVVNLPTSSGKTFIAEFRILQALNQFERERGWVAYLAPTRALVNQVSARLRRDFAPLGINVERVSPALELDSLESGLLTDTAPETQFRVLVTTPEKLDLMIRGSWEEKIGRPLSLVVVDEAHNIGQGERGIKLELLLATVNRECKNAQFLLLTPFIRNAREVASWLSPESHSTVELTAHWAPNDRIIALSKPRPSTTARAFRIHLETLHTSRETLTIPEEPYLCDGRPLNLTLRKVETSSSDLAAATAQCLQERGPCIVLCARPDWCWSLAEKFKLPINRRVVHEDVALVQRFISHEFGADFELNSLLEHGVGVHHAGLSDETKALMEWLFENERLNVLVATTTIAQGVNFPVASVVLAHHQLPDGRRMVPMPAADFWNIAGRAGRADHAAAGLVALAAVSDEKAEELRQFVDTQVLTLNSTLIEMVQAVLESGRTLELHTPFNRPEWSAFLQYLAHTYRQIDSPERFAQQVDRILRGTLGFQKLREINRSVAQALVEGAQAYGARIADKPLSLVDSTGFSWETVSLTLSTLSRERITEAVWDPSLFSSGTRDLQKLMGILLEVPELRENLAAATGGRGPNGDLLARMIADWVNGASLPQLAEDYFTRDEAGRSLSKTGALTQCCRNIYGRLSQTASWGLAALQAMTLGTRFDSLPEGEQQAIRNLPSRVFYGVSSDEAIPLRLLGVPRNAAQPIAEAWREATGRSVMDEALVHLRSSLATSDRRFWSDALGDAGADYWKVWTVLESVR